MSQADIVRFIADLKSNDELRNEVTGTASGLESVVGVAREHGYDITVDEARDYVRSQASSELSDEQLDQIAGGKSGSSSTATSATADISVSVIAVTSANVQTNMSSLAIEICSTSTMALVA